MIIITITKTCFLFNFFFSKIGNNEENEEQGKYNKYKKSLRRGLSMEFLWAFIVLALRTTAIYIEGCIIIYANLNLIVILYYFILVF